MKRQKKPPNIRSRRSPTKKKTEDGGFYGAAVRVLSRHASSANSPSSTDSITGIGSMFGQLGSPLMPPVDLKSLQHEREQRDRQIDEKLSKLKACVTAKRALSELRRVGIDEREVILYLGYIWQTCRNEPKRLTNVPGVSLKDIRKLPNLLRGIARQISAINEHRAMPSVFWSRIRKELPGALYGYALDLERKLSGPTSKVRLGTAQKVQFAHFVRTIANDRKPHFGELAALINAFNEIEDGEQGVTSNMKSVKPAALKVLYGEHPEFTNLPPFPPCLSPFGKLK